MMLCLHATVQRRRSAQIYKSFLIMCENNKILSKRAKKISPHSASLCITVCIHLNESKRFHYSSSTQYKIPFSNVWKSVNRHRKILFQQREILLQKLCILSLYVAVIIVLFMCVSSLSRIRYNSGSSVLRHKLNLNLLQNNNDNNV